MADEKADEPPQAHDYRIGRHRTTDDPPGVRSHAVHMSGNSIGAVSPTLPSVA
jgi:hypothetical protein